MSSYKKKLEELVRVIHGHPRSRSEEGVEEEEVGRGEEELVCGGTCTCKIVGNDLREWRVERAMEKRKEDRKDGKDEQSKWWRGQSGNGKDGTIGKTKW